jgi:DNA-binding transcriptional MerR regulator
LWQKLKGMGGKQTADELSLAELAEKAEIPARTIRFYIARGLMPGPLKAGRGACYGAEHLRRLAEIKQWQRKGLTLTEIARQIAGNAQPLRVMETPTSWWSYPLAPDVVVQVRADASPWRLRQIQRALQEAANRLAQPTNEGDDGGSRS